jgi:hypothetical protein
MYALLFILIAAQTPGQAFTSPASPAPEYGHGLSAADARAGWIALFDGATTYGWTDASVDSAVLTKGMTTSLFGPCQVKGEATSGGEIHLGDQSLRIKPGEFDLQFAGPIGSLKLSPGVALKTLLLKPDKLKSVINGHDLTGWTVLKHPQGASQQQTKWTVTEGGIRCIGGPGALELHGRYDDFVLQLEARMLRPLSNGGLFFRSIPGDFMNGYEAQLFNGCYDHDPGKPARYSTGAIDDRQLARRLVSRDGEPFTMTVIAAGPHIATWVNGFQTTDWTDTREVWENPREGLRTMAGTIQLQAHDADTEIEYRRVLIGERK